MNREVSVGVRTTGLESEKRKKDWDRVDGRSEGGCRVGEGQGRWGQEGGGGCFEGGHRGGLGVRGVWGGGVAQARTRSLITVRIFLSGSSISMYSNMQGSRTQSDVHVYLKA